jgi:hypothetical protein
MFGWNIAQTLAHPRAISAAKSAADNKNADQAAAGYARFSYCLASARRAGLPSLQKKRGPPGRR